MKETKQMKFQIIDIDSGLTILEDQYQSLNNDCLEDLDVIREYIELNQPQIDIHSIEINLI